MKQLKLDKNMLRHKSHEELELLRHGLIGFVVSVEEGQKMR